MPASTHHLNLPLVARGARIAAFALSEPDDGCRENDTIKIANYIDNTRATGLNDSKSRWKACAATSGRCIATRVRPCYSN